ncbi:MAG TPA: homoserine dehydrogenase [Elusimicrobia bacterium]|nr:homoserine dehydrogenase [Elusimicrobiota bacterium]
MINLGLVGYGTVGSGVVKILETNLSLLENKVGTKLNLKKICDRDKKRLRNLSAHRFALAGGKIVTTTNWEEIVNDPKIDIVIELIGGYEPARTIILSAIKKKKHIATANKALLAKHWDEIFTTAGKNKVLVYFEASVGAGIPVVQALNEGLAANRIHSILGILNATTNYILTRMSKKNIDFPTALKETQKAGFAEANPKLDIEGIDAAHKLSILASIAYSSWVKLENIYTEGISHLDQQDIKFAFEEFGYETKLLGICKEVITSNPERSRRIDVRVHPALIPQEHPFATVENEYNAVLIKGDAVGDVMFYGKGAGGMSAASAVVSDIIYLARHIHNQTAGKIPYVTYQKGKKLSFLPIGEIETAYYLRFTTVDRPGVLSKISGILGENKVSIASCFQKVPTTLRPRGVPILMVTHKAKEKNIRQAIEEIDRLPITRAKTVMLRIEE